MKDNKTFVITYTK